MTIAIAQHSHVHCVGPALRNGRSTRASRGIVGLIRPENLLSAPARPPMSTPRDFKRHNENSQSSLKCIYYVFRRLVVIVMACRNAAPTPRDGSTELAPEPWSKLYAT